MRCNKMQSNAVECSTSRDFPVAERQFNNLEEFGALGLELRYAIC